MPTSPVSFDPSEVEVAGHEGSAPVSFDQADVEVAEQPSRVMPYVREAATRAKNVFAGPGTVLGNLYPPVPPPPAAPAPPQPPATAGYTPTPREALPAPEPIGQAAQILPRAGLDMLVPGLGWVAPNQAITKPLVDPSAAKLEEMVPTSSTPAGREALAKLIPVLGAFRPAAAEQAARGLVKGGEELAGGFTTPENVAILGGTAGLGALGSAAGAVGKLGPIISRLIGAGFGVKMLNDAYDQIPQFKKAVDAHDIEGATQIATQIVGQGAMGGAGLAHGGLDLIRQEPLGAYRARQEARAPSERDIGAGGARGPVEPEVLRGGGLGTGEPPPAGPKASPQAPVDIPKAPEPTKTDRPGPRTPVLPTAAVPTVPEAPETLDHQFGQMGQAVRKVVMVPAANTDYTPPTLPAGISVTADKFGNRYYYDTQQGATASQVRKAVRENKLTELLGGPVGMGAPDKSEIAPGGPVVVVRAPDGTEVQATATTPEVLPITLAAHEPLVPPGGSIDVENAPQVLQQRGESPSREVIEPQPQTPQPGVPQSLEAPPAIGETPEEIIRSVPPEELLRMKDQATRYSNTELGHAVDAEIEHRFGGAINPRRVVYVGDGYIIRGAEQAGKFRTESAALTALLEEAAGKPLPTTIETTSPPETSAAVNPKSSGKEGALLHPPSVANEPETKPVGLSVKPAEPTEVVKQEPHEFSSTQVNLPTQLHPAFARATASILDADLDAAGGKSYGGESSELGRETEPHITIKYGLHDGKAEATASVLSGVGPIKAKIGKISLFKNDKFDVVKLDIESPDLHRLNKKIAELPHTDTHPTYTPHITLAYVKPGAGQKYEGQSVPGLTGQEVTFNSVEFSAKDRTKTEIPLRKPVTPQVPHGTSGSTPLDIPPALGEVLPADEKAQRLRMFEELGKAVADKRISVNDAMELVRKKFSREWDEVEKSHDERWNQLRQPFGIPTVDKGAINVAPARPEPKQITATTPVEKPSTPVVAKPQGIESPEAIGAPFETKPPKLETKPPVLEAPPAIGETKEIVAAHSRAKRPTSAQRNKALAEHRRKVYAPGNVVRTYDGGLDRVLSYEEKPDGTFSVTVQAINPDGSIDPNFPRPRTHRTEPDAGTKVVSVAAPQPVKPERSEPKKKAEPSADAFDDISHELGLIGKNSPAYQGMSPEAKHNLRVELESDLEHHRPAAEARAQAEIDREKGKAPESKPLPSGIEAEFATRFRDQLAEARKRHYLEADPEQVKQTIGNLTRQLREGDSASAVVGDRDVIIHRKSEWEGKGKKREQKITYTGFLTGRGRSTINATFRDPEAAVYWATEALHSLGVRKDFWDDFRYGGANRAAERLVKNGEMLANTESAMAASDAAANAIGQPKLAGDIYHEAFSGGWKPGTSGMTFSDVAMAYADNLPRNEEPLLSSRQSSRGVGVTDRPDWKLLQSKDPAKGYQSWEQQVEEYERSAKGIADNLKNIRRRIETAKQLNGGSTNRIAESDKFFDGVQENVKKNLAYVKEQAKAETAKELAETREKVRPLAEAYAKYGEATFPEGVKQGNDPDSHMRRYARLKGLSVEPLKQGAGAHQGISGWRAVVDDLGITAKQPPARVDIPSAGKDRLVKAEVEALKQVQLGTDQRVPGDTGTMQKLQSRGWVGDDDKLTPAGESAVYSLRIGKSEAEQGYPMEKYATKKQDTIPGMGDTRFGNESSAWNTVDGEVWHTNGHGAWRGEFPRNWAARNKDTPGPNLSQVVAPGKDKGNLEPIKPVGFNETELQGGDIGRSVYFDNGSAMAAPLYDYTLRRVGSPMEWQQESVKEPFFAYDKDGKIAAVVMPLRVDNTPGGIKGLLDPEKLAAAESATKRAADRRELKSLKKSLEERTKYEKGLKPGEEPARGARLPVGIDTKEDANARIEELERRLAAPQHCFPYSVSVETEIGSVPIGKIVSDKMDIRVLSCDNGAGSLSWKKITGWHSNSPTYPLVQVTHERGSLDCTANHEIWATGYIPAFALDDTKVLRVVRRADEGIEVPVLLDQLLGKAQAFDARLSREVPAVDRTFMGLPEGQEVSIVINSNEGPKSNEKSGCVRENAEILVGPYFSGARRQRFNYQRTTDSHRPDGISFGISDPHAPGARPIPVTSKLLHGGPCGPAAPSSHRSGREDPSPQAVEVSGPPQDRDTQCSRVVGVAFHERGSQYGPDFRSDPNSRVYCLSVEQNHNFFANGVLVSNSTRVEESGVKKFVESEEGSLGPAANKLIDEVAEKVKDFTGGVAEIMDDLRRTVAPQTRGEVAKMGAGTVREMAGRLARQESIAKATIEVSRDHFQKQPAEFGVHAMDVIDAIESGDVSGLDKQSRDFAKTIRDAFDGRYNLLASRHILRGYVENYITHAYKNGGQLAEAFANQWMTKRPLVGSESFKHERSFETFREALEFEGPNGEKLIPKFDNPVDYALYGLSQMDHSIYGHDVFDEWKKNGLLRYVSDNKPPAGYAKIEDRIFTVFGPPRGAVSLPARAALVGVEPVDIKVHGQRIMGHYYAPEPLAAVANNYLSKGWEGKKAYDVYMAVKGGWNSLNLGFSAFHGATTVLNSSFADMAHGMGQALAGRPVQGAKSIALGIVPGASALQDYLRGTELEKVYKGQVKNPDPMSVAIVEALEIAGYKRELPWDPDAWLKGLKTAYRDGNYAGAMARLANPLLWAEQFPVSKAIMEKLVPRAKLGAAAKAIQLEIDKHPGMDVQEARERFGEIIDSMDNSFGQLNTRNMLMRGTVRSWMNVVMARPGWTLGTARGALGGAADMIGSLRKAARGDDPELSHRAKLLLAWIFGGMLINGLMTALLTQSVPDGEDFLNPRDGGVTEDGRPSRIVMPSYWSKDFQSWRTRPVQTLIAKLSQPLMVAGQVMRNRTWRDEKILGKGGVGAKAYAKQTVMPYMAGGIEKNLERGASLDKTVLPSLGIMPASRYASMSKAEKIIADYNEEHTSRTRPASTEHSRARAKLFVASRAGDPQQVRRIGAELVRNGTVTQRDVDNVVKQMRFTPLINDFKRVSDINVAMEAYEAGTEAERKQMYQDMRAKLNNARSKASEWDSDTRRLAREWFKMQPDHAIGTPPPIR